MESQEGQGLALAFGLGGIGLATICSIAIIVCFIV
jgi:hypothetical protein